MRYEIRIVRIRSDWGGRELWEVAVEEVRRVRQSLGDSVGKNLR